MAYIGSRPDNVISRNAQNEYNYTATGGQTTFTGADSNNNTLSYTPGNIEVYFNGARLEESDFTATNGTSIVLANAAVVNDELSIVAMRVFEVGSISNFNTSDLTEGSNLYFTNARADARIAAADTDDLSEGSTNLYFTNARADARIAAADTDDLSEGSTNLYFTNARVAGYLSSNDFDTATNIVASITDSAPSTLDTLNELAAALGDDANFSTTVTNSIATKLPLAGGTLTGALDVQSTVTADGLTVDGTGVEVVSVNSTQNGAQINFDSASTSVDWSVGISNNADGDFLIYQSGSGSGDILLYTGGAKRQEINRNGDISFYEDTGSTAKFFWDASAERLFVGDNTTTMPSVVTGAGLMVTGTSPTGVDGGQLVIKSSELTSDAGNGGGLVFDNYNGVGNRVFGAIQVLKENSTSNNNDSYMRFTTRSNSGGLTERMRIDSSGRLGIATGGVVNTNAHANADDLVIGNTSNRTGMTIVSDPAQNGNIHFSDGTSTGNANIKGQFTYEHSDNSFRFYVNSTTEVLRLTSSGGTVFNNGQDINQNFTVKASGNSGALFIDGAGGNVSVNQGNFSSNPTGSKLNVFGDGEVLRLDGTGNTSRTLRFRGVSSANPAIIMADGSLEITNEDANTSLALLSERDITIKTTKSNGTPGHVKFYSYNTEIMRIDGSNNRVGIGTTSPTGYLHIAGNGTTNDRMFNISTTGIGGGQNGVFYGGKVQVQANNSATENFGWHVYAEHSGIHSPTTGISGEAKTGSSNVRALGVHGIADSNSAAVNYGPNTANAVGVVAGVYAEAKTYNSTNNATISALIAQNRSSAANTAYGAWINTTPGPTSIIPLSVNHNGTEKFTVNALADAMVHVKGDPADTGTTGGSDGLSIAYDGGRSCPIYFGTETNSAQKSMYMTGYWIYLRGHQNEGIRFVFSQGAGSAPRSDQYQFKYNSATRPTGNTTWDGFSDVRAKENVQNITGALDTISQLRPVVFDWTDDYADRMNMFKMDETDPKSYNWTSVKENGYDLDRKTSQIGFIAQEFETVFPKSITEQELELGDTTIEDFKTVNYDHLIPTLTKAIQELKAENDALKARLDAAGL